MTCQVKGSLHIITWVGNPVYRQWEMPSGYGSCRNHRAVASEAKYLDSNCQGFKCLCIGTPTATQTTHEIVQKNILLVNNTRVKLHVWENTGKCRLIAFFKMPLYLKKCLCNFPQNTFTSYAFSMSFSLIVVHFKHGCFIWPGM